MTGVPALVFADNPPSRKTPGWQGRLVGFLRAHHARPFEPGKWDCAIWAANAVKTMTGEDLMRGFGGYQSVREGKKRLQAAGYNDHVAYAAAWFPEILPSFAQAGDLAVIGKDSLGIVQGHMVYCFGLNGFGVLPFDQIARAFRI
jgi:hypothetical protein